MKIAVSGADERYTYLQKMLAEMGEEAVIARRAGDLLGADGLVSAYPFTEEVARGLEGMSAGARLWLIAPGGMPDLPERFSAESLLEDAAFVNENAILTAEGAVALAMTRTPFALSGSRVMVIGYGRVGRALTEFLVGLRAVTTVVSRREQGRLQAMARGAYAASADKIKSELADQRVVFVATAERALGADELMYASKRALIFDLSSAPYGVDADAAREMGLTIYREAALPGRYCPESAAKALMRAVSRRINGREDE